MSEDDTSELGQAQVFEQLKYFLAEVPTYASNSFSDDQAKEARFAEIYSVLKTLFREFVEEFPTTGIWSQRHAVFSQSALQIVTQSLTFFFRYQDSIVESWITQLIKFSGNMEYWIRRELSDEVTLGGPSPQALRDQALDTACTWVAHIYHEPAHQEQPEWGMAKSIINEVCLSATGIYPDFILERTYH